MVISVCNLATQHSDVDCLQDQCLIKLQVHSGLVADKQPWIADHVPKIQAAALVIDKLGTVWVPNGRGITMVRTLSVNGSVVANATNCPLDNGVNGETNSLAALTIAADGFILMLDMHGRLVLLSS